MPPSKDLEEINMVGMIAIDIVASIVGIIFLSFIVRCFIKIYKNVKERVPNVTMRMVSLQLIIVS